MGELRVQRQKQMPDTTSTTLGISGTLGDLLRANGPGFLSPAQRAGLHTQQLIPSQVGPTHTVHCGSTTTQFIAALQAAHTPVIMTRTQGGALG